MATTRTRRTTVLLPLLLTVLLSMLLPAPAEAHHGSSGDTSVTADDRTALELVAEAYLLAEHNEQRAAGDTRDGARHGDVDTAPPLEAWTDITTVSRRWADTMTWDRFEHNPAYHEQYGHWNAAGENIGIATVARASDTPSKRQVRMAAERIMDGWWGSTGHRTNLMADRWDHVGLGVELRKETLDNGTYWTLAAVANFRAWDGSTVDGDRYPIDGNRPPNESDHGASDGPFDDVPGDHIFATNIERLAESGVTRGCGDGDDFCPGKAVTRGQMAAFLTRALDLPAGSRTFDDARGHLFERAIAALAEAGITRGCGDGNDFCPDEAVTRGQMAAFLTRALDLPAGSRTFDDSRGHLFERAIAALADAGITTGCGGHEFCPDEAVTRGQMAAFLDRAGVLG